MIGTTTPAITGSVTNHGIGRCTAGLTALLTKISTSNSAMRAASSVSPTMGCAFIHMLNRRTTQE
jgi:hypothetical protein